MTEPLLMPAPTPTIRREEDGSFWAVDRFPEVLAISRELLESGEDGVSHGIERCGDVVDIRLANGRWIYRIAEWRDDLCTAICRIVYREDSSC